MNFKDHIHLRIRLMRRISYRFWRDFILSSARFMIDGVKFEDRERLASQTPVIFLTSFVSPEDFFILSYIYRDCELTFVSLEDLPKSRIFNILQSVNHVLYFQDSQPGFLLFRKILRTLRESNRPIVISPEATRRYAKSIFVDRKVIVRIAMMAHVPVIPVSFNWCKKVGLFGRAVRKCTIWVGKKIYISPRTKEFQDIFFSRRGHRKFSQLSQAELDEIGTRIFSRLS